MKNDMRDLASAYTQAAQAPVAERLRKLEEQDRIREKEKYSSSNVANYYLGKKAEQKKVITENVSQEEKSALFDIAYEIFEIGSRLKYNDVREEDGEYLHNASRQIEKLLQAL